VTPVRIADGTLVSLDVSLYDAQGNLLEKSEAPLRYLHGHEEIFARIESALTGRAAGDHLQLQLEPEDAFGEYDPELVVLAPVAGLGADAAVGRQVEAAATGDGEPCTFTITDIADGMAVLDGNHPLAGMALRFDIRVVEVRAATPEELAAADGDAPPDFLSVVGPSSRLH
jgi:FKBP-type peptidyl-prolyl cis-trans isomerase SlyD